MLKSHLLVYEEGPAPDVRDWYVALGCFFDLIAKSGGGFRGSSEYVAHVLKPAIHHRKYKILFDEDRNVAAYVIWATLAPDVERRFIEWGDFRLDYSEWNEGDSLWILDLVVPRGHTRHVLDYLRDTLFHDTDRVRYFKSKHGRTVVREIARSDRVSFMHPGGSRASDVGATSLD